MFGEEFLLLLGPLSLRWRSSEMMEARIGPCTALAITISTKNLNRINFKTLT